MHLPLRDNSTVFITFHAAAFALGCRVQDVKALVITKKLRCVNVGHDKDRILMTSSRVLAEDVKRLVIAQILPFPYGNLRDGLCISWEVHHTPKCATPPI